MPAEVVTFIGPVVTDAGAVAWICVSAIAFAVAVTPLKVTLVRPVKCLPLMNTVVFEGPDPGVKPEMYGPEPITVN